MPSGTLSGFGEPCPIADARADMTALDHKVHSNLYPTPVSVLR